MHRLLTRLRVVPTLSRAAASDRAAGDVGPIIRTDDEWAQARAERRAIEDWARANPDTVCS